MNREWPSRGARSRELVIFIHGLWLNGTESLVLRHRLERDFGFAAAVFRYPSLTAPMSEIIRRLATFVAGVDAARLHFVAHSLGGLVVYRFLEAGTAVLPAGRVVFLGTPSVASRAALAAARLSWAAPLIGRAVAEELLCARDRRWTFERDLGVIAGSRPMGLGRFVARFNEPNDGTVAVSETRLVGATAHLVLPVSHMGLLLSARTAAQCGGFLRQGAFA
ncbi:MAG TPA: alpha/beta fold hydrolase [Steroidobacteraceae bacterium]